MVSKAKDRPNYWGPSPYWSHGPYPIETCMQYGGGGYYELTTVSADDIPGPIIARSSQYR